MLREAVRWLCRLLLRSARLAARLRTSGPHPCLRAPPARGRARSFGASTSRPRPLRLGTLGASGFARSCRQTCSGCSPPTRRQKKNRYLLQSRIDLEKDGYLVANALMVRCAFERRLRDANHRRCGNPNHSARLKHTSM